jgi:hypothetical protein
MDLWLFKSLRLIYGEYAVEKIDLGLIYGEYGIKKMDMIRWTWRIGANTGSLRFARHMQKRRYIARAVR